MAESFVCKRSLNVFKGFKTCTRVVLESKETLPLEYVLAALTVGATLLLLATRIGLKKSKPPLPPPEAPPPAVNLTPSFDAAFEDVKSKVQTVVEDIKWKFSPKPEVRVTLEV